MTKPQRLVATAVALAAVFAFKAQAGTPIVGSASLAALAGPGVGADLLALLALTGGCLVFWLTLKCTLRLRPKFKVTGFRPAGAAAGGQALAPAKYRPPFPSLTARPRVAARAAFHRAAPAEL